ncbi:MAG TPA: hypothetical protein VMT63_01100 [Bacteroidales bacterium]|nr:hypothetical protein [Bacteroidales bacterium]
MRKIFYILVLLVPLVSCKKASENIVWERSYGKGRAAFVKNTGDTAFLSCGELDGKQYLLLTDHKGTKKLEYKSGISGILTAAYAGNGYFIAAGSSGGKLSISRIDTAGTLIWDTLFTSSFTVEHSVLCHLSGTSFMAIGSADPDSSFKTDTGISILWFDADGNIAEKRDTLSTGSYVAVKDAAADNSGNFYLAITRNSTTGKLKSSVALFNSTMDRIWERELSNNPQFGAASLAIAVDDNNNPVISGRTEMQVSTGTTDNAFVARYFHKGDSVQKTYLEYINSASAISRNSSGEFMVLNSGCLVVNIMDERMKVSGFVRTFSSCDSKTTDVFGYTMDVMNDGNIVMAGSKGTGYYLAVKSSSDLSPV